MLLLVKGLDFQLWHRQWLGVDVVVLVFDANVLFFSQHFKGELKQRRVVCFQVDEAAGLQSLRHGCARHRPARLDFGIPRRLGLTYVGADNKDHHPYVIHRAPLGTHERFVAFLVEMYGGAFPTWLAPVQVRVIPVSEKFDEYGKKIVAELRAQMIRAEMDPTQDTMGKKIRNGTKQKIPNLLIIGEKEQTDGTVTLRRYGQEQQVTLPIADFKTMLVEKIRTRARS